MPRIKELIRCIAFLQNFESSLQNKATGTEITAVNVSAHARVDFRYVLIGIE
jgi:hypothetical protein